MNKVQLTLTDQEVAILNNYGAQLGYNLPRTLRYIISKASEQVLRDGSVPVYAASSAIEEKALKATREHKAGQTFSMEEFSEKI
jgi:hypothetical protein